MSPIRDAKGLPGLQPVDGYDISLIVGVQFQENQLNDKGWFIDTDSASDTLEDMNKHLSSKKWTELFEFRPTFELVSRWIHEQLSTKIPQLAYVEIKNKTFDIVIKYNKD